MLSRSAICTVNAEIRRQAAKIRKNVFCKYTPVISLIYWFTDLVDTNQGSFLVARDTAGVSTDWFGLACDDA